MTRTELHELVWSLPMRKLAKSFGMSDVALAKHCKKARVPVPPRGWWARKEAGKKVSIAPLPALPIGRLGCTLGLPLPKDSAKIGPKSSADIDPDAAPSFPDISLFRSEVEGAVREVRVAARALGGHRIVDRLLQIEGKKAADPNDFEVKYYGARFGAPIQRRRLRILSALFSSLERSGCNVAGNSHKGEVFSLSARGVSFSLVLGVESPHGEHYSPYARWYGKSGSKSRLRLQVGDYGLDHDPRYAKPAHEWADGEQSLELQLTGAVRRIIVFAEEQRRALAINSHRWRVEYCKQQDEERRKAVVKAEADRIAREEAAAAARLRTLLDEADAIGQADRIRAYIVDVQRRIAADPSLASPDDVEAWSSWANAEADRIDPVVSGRFLKVMKSS